MTSDDPKGVIELGNVNIKCIIFKVGNNNSVEILSLASAPSDGIHNGVIVNLSKASSAIRSCISTAEKKIKISLKKISVIVEQPEFLCTKFSKHKKIGGSKIHKDDIEFLLNDAKKQVTSNDKNQSIIHIFNHNYIVDGKKFLEEPIDVYADHVRHEMTFITMPKNNIRNINEAFTECDIEVERLISCTFALAAHLLNSDKLQQGSVLIDIGFEKVSVGLFQNLALVHSTTIPIGVNHITKDISKGCSLSLLESQEIKDEFDFSFENKNDLFDENYMLKDSYFKNSDFRKISKSLIFNIIKARLDEILEMIKKQLVSSKSNQSFLANVFITGGGSNLKHLEKYCSNFFGFKIENLDKKVNRLDMEKNFPSCLGAIKIIKDGWETEAIPKKVDKFSNKIGFFAKIFR